MRFGFALAVSTLYLLTSTNTYHDRPVREPAGQSLVDLHAKVTVSRYLQARKGARDTLSVLWLDQVLDRLGQVGLDRYEPAALPECHVPKALGLRITDRVVHKRNRDTRCQGFDLRKEGLRGQRAVEDVCCTKCLEIFGVLE